MKDDDAPLLILPDQELMDERRRQRRQPRLFAALVAPGERIVIRTPEQVAAQSEKR